MYKFAGISVLAISLMGFSTNALAQDFSFEAERKEIKSLGGIGATGTLYRGASWNGTYVAAFKGEEPTKGTYECVSTSQPPGIFRIHSACTMTQAEGSFTSSWGCNPYNKDGSEMGCVAGLRGTSGRFENLVGLANSHIKGNTSNGTGQFFKVGE